MAFVKIDCGILDSTLWIDRPARELFLTALLMAEPWETTEPLQQIEIRTLAPTGWLLPPGWYGFVPAAGIGIIHRAQMEQDAGFAALERLSSPEPDSRSAEYDGRRLIRVDGGYVILNYMRYRDRDYTSATRSKRYRDRLKAESSRRVVTASPRNITQADNRDVEKEEDLDLRSFGDLSNLERENPTTSANNGKSASLSPAARPPTDEFTDLAVTERAGRFIERYEELYREHRKGARYAVRPVRDYAASVTLCRTWQDDGRLDKLAVIFLNSDHRFAEEGSRTIPQFLALASWCDGKLAEHEAQVKS